MDREIELDVVLARNGDAAAFTRLVEISSSTVCSIALAIARNVPASEDIAQETYLAAWRGLRNLRNPASFLPWLRQVARNQARLWQREHHREISDENVLAGATDVRTTPAESLLVREEQQILDEVLGALPDDTREVLVLYYREGSSTSQVATLLGLSDDAVRQRLSRARSAVRDEILQRFGRAALRTTPGGAFAAAVAGALTAAGPPATAAAATTAGGLASAAVAKATILGGALGWFGVLMGMRSLEPPFDEREARELRRFRNVVLAAVTLGSLAIALASSTPMGLLVSVQSVYLVLGLLYFLVLPRILRRRMEWERSVNPEEARLSRRQWMWATIGRAVGAAIGGAMVMAMIIIGF